MGRGNANVAKHRWQTPSDKEKYEKNVFIELRTYNTLPGEK